MSAFNAKVSRPGSIPECPYSVRVNNPEGDEIYHYRNCTLAQAHHTLEFAAEGILIVQPRGTQLDVCVA